MDRNRNIASLLVKNTVDVHREMLDRLIDFRERVLDFIAGIIDQGIKRASSGRWTRALRLSCLWGCCRRRRPSATSVPG